LLNIERFQHDLLSVDWFEAGKGVRFHGSSLWIRKQKAREMFDYFTASCPRNVPEIGPLRFRGEF
jgi:hypothetical protein